MTFESLMTNHNIEDIQDVVSNFESTLSAYFFDYVKNNIAAETCLAYMLEELDNHCEDFIKIKRITAFSESELAFINANFNVIKDIYDHYVHLIKEHETALGKIENETDYDLLLAQSEQCEVILR